MKGAVTYPLGFQAAAIGAGIKNGTVSRNDVCLIVSQQPCMMAGVFTQNLVKAAPVKWSQSILTSNNQACAVLINSGNANACTGEHGHHVVQQTVHACAQALNMEPNCIAVASTGVIGVPFPVERLLVKIPELVQQCQRTPEKGALAAQAMMTTDLVSKEYAVEVQVDDHVYRVGGMAKGSGMIHPNMATMLGVITTDAPLSFEQAQTMLQNATQKSFNAITVDGDTSTNDCVFLMANGAAQGSCKPGSLAEQKIAQAVEEVCLKLAEMIAIDGEGAKKLIVVHVQGTASDADAMQIAKTIAASPLVKTAVAGGDPNWGRVLAAAGRAGISFNPDEAELSIGDHCVALHGMARPEGESGAAEHMLQNRVEFYLRVGSQHGQATALGCDLTEGYVQINGHYRT